MNKILKIFTFLYLLINTHAIFSQDSVYINKIDSLNSIINNKDVDKLSVYDQLSFNYYYSNNYAKTIEYAKKILDNIDTVHNKQKQNKYIARANELIGVSYYSMDIYSRALEYSSKALIAAKEIHDTILIINISLDLGNIYEGLLDNDRAKKYYKNVILYSKLINDKSNLALAYNNLGIIASNNKKYEKAMGFYKKSAALKKEIFGNSDAISYLNIGDIYIKWNKLDSAKKYFDKALKIQEDEKNKHVLSIIYQNLGLLYLKKNEIDIAKEYLKKAKQIAVDNKLNNSLISSYYLLSQMYETQQDYKNSLFYHKKYSDLSDSLAKINQKTHISQVELLYKAEKQKLKIEKLKIDSELKSLKITSYKHRQLFLIITGLILLIVTIIILFQKNKIKSAYNRIVIENVQLTNYRDQIKKLKKEISNLYKNKEDKVNDNKVIEEKYSESSLTDTQKRIIADKIQKAFDDDKVFLDTELKLLSLSKKIGVNKTYVSQVFNEVLNIGFLEMVNQYRIDEARKLLIDENNTNITIEAIAEKAGFKSSSTFNRIFKKETGVTPSYFLKSVKNNNINPY